MRLLPTSHCDGSTNTVKLLARSCWKEVPVDYSGFQEIHLHLAPTLLCLWDTTPIEWVSKRDNSKSIKCTPVRWSGLLENTLVAIINTLYPTFHAGFLF